MQLPILNGFDHFADCFSGLRDEFPSCSSRHRGDMIETYKIIHGLYDTAVAPSFFYYYYAAFNVPCVGHKADESLMSQVSHTRGNMYKLQKMYFKYDIRRYFFTERIVNLWNSLPSLVVEAPPINCFKMRLDKFWSNQDVLYNFKTPFL